MTFPVESLVRRPGTQGGDAKRWTRYNSSSGV